MRGLYAILALVLMAGGCGGKVDYDISEAAPEEHLDGEGEDHHHGEHDHAEDEVGRDISGAVDNRHHHEPGVRNHGTQWFFNQPWAATFIWGKMLRDAVILLALAAGVFLVSRLFRRRWQR